MRKYTIGIHCFQQLAGGNAIMMYSSSIFKSNHADEKTALIGTILIGATTVDGIYSYSLIIDGKFEILLMQ